MATRSAAFHAVIVLLGGLLGSCAAPNAGPQAWIDTPRDNATAPLAPLTIIAHASASGGVGSIEFTVDDQPYRVVAADGERLVWREIEWTPPGTGTYRIGARGIGTSGAVGTLTTSLVTISDAASLPIPLPAPATATVATIAPPVTATHITPPASAAPSVVAKMNSNCREGPGTVHEVYGNLLEGQQAEIAGRLSDNSWFLIHLIGRSRSCWIAASVVEVHGELGTVQVVSAPQPPPQIGLTATAHVVEPAPIPIDTTPPSFYSAAAERGKCPHEAQTVTVAAAVGDDVGLSSVIAYWSMGGGLGGQVTLSMGGLGYWAEIGPVDAEGTMEIYIVATDTSGNPAQSQMLYVQIVECIG